MDQTHDADQDPDSPQIIIAGDTYLVEAMDRRPSGREVISAVRLVDGAPVCIKRLRYSAASDLDAIERHRREARILRQVDHPRVPRLVAYEERGERDDCHCFIVQERVHGAALADELDGHRYDEREVLAILAELLRALAPLHALSPAVVHGDLRAEHVMRRASDGALMLVDFGAAPTGAIGVASDLRAVGELGVALLTRRDPRTPCGGDGAARWTDAATVTKGGASIIDDLVATPEGASHEDTSAAATRIRLALRPRVSAMLRPRRRSSWIYAPIALIACVLAALMWFVPRLSRPGAGEAARSARQHRRPEISSARALAPPAREEPRGLDISVRAGRDDRVAVEVALDADVRLSVSVGCGASP